MLTEFQRKQLDKIELSTEIGVVDLLKLVIDDIQKGVFHPDGVMVILLKRGTDQAWETSRYRAGLPRDHEIAMLELAKFRALTSWTNP